MKCECDSFPPFSLVLTVSNNFRKRLSMRALQALVGRLQIRFHLTALMSEDKVHYVEHQLQVGGAEGEIFTRLALQGCTK